MNARRAVPFLAAGGCLALWWGAWLTAPGDPPPASSRTAPVLDAGAPPGPPAGVRRDRAGTEPGGGDPRAALEVRGRVLDGAGGPVEGAEVVALHPAPPAEEGAAPVPPSPEGEVDAEVLRELFALTPGEAASVKWVGDVPVPPAAPPQAREAARARSAADGSFALRVGSPGPFRVEADGEGRGSAAADGVRAGGAPLSLRLGPGTGLRGLVVRDDGSAPVEGAVVVARSGPAAASAISGADGSFALSLPGRGRFRLEAGAQGYAPAILAFVEVPRGEPVEVRLGTGWAVDVKAVHWDVAVLRGRRPGSPRDAGRSPLEGATVVLLHRASDSARAGVTGPDGTVRVDRLFPGTWELAVRKEGYGVGLGRSLRCGPGTPSPESREVRLSPLVASTLVVRGEDGAPLRGAAVYTGGEDEEFDPRRSRLLGRTDEGGRIAVAFDEAVPWKAVAWVVPEGGGAAVRVEAGEPGEERKVAVPPGRVVRGTVKDSRGRPLGGANVSLLVEKDEREMGLELRTTSDPGGAFRFPAVPYGGATIEVETAEGDFGHLEVEGGNREDPLVREVVVEVFGDMGE